MKASPRPWFVLLPGMLLFTGCMQTGGPTPSPEQPVETSRSHAESVSASGRTLYVEIAGPPAGEGPVYLALYDSAETFHGEPLKKRRAEFAGGVARADFDRLPAGTFAVSAFLDQNGNGELDRGMMGIPLEPVGNSNNGSLAFGPPDFDQASIELAGEITEILVRLVCPVECLEPWPSSGR